MSKYEAANTYTDAELLALYREAAARVSVSGQSYKLGTKEFTAADLPEIRRMIDWLDQRVNAAAGQGMAHNVARLKRPQ